MYEPQGKAAGVEAVGEKQNEQVSSEGPCSSHWIVWTTLFNQADDCFRPLDPWKIVIRLMTLLRKVFKGQI